MYYLYKYVYRLFFGVQMSEIFAENFAALSDEQLVSLVRTGNNECFLILRKRYCSVIESFADKYSSICARHDLIYAGNIGFADAVMSYREGAGASFRTFAKICINSKMQEPCRKANAGMRIPSEMIMSIDDVDVPDINDPESIFIKKEYVDSLMAMVKARLSDLEYTVLSEFESGKSYKEIAEEIGINVKSVENALTRARAKIKKIKR